MPRQYTRHATPEAAKEARRASARRSMAKNREKYAEKSKASAKARYQANREQIIEKAKARYAANPERQKEINRRRYPLVAARIRERCQSIRQIFEALPEEHREEYAEWLLFLGGVDSYTQQAISSPSLDYNYIGAYAPI